MTYALRKPSKGVAMKLKGFLAPLLFAVITASCASAQTQLPKPEPSTAPAPLKFQRLILKDGTYQIVSKYEKVGDRVRYTSAERGDTVEEVPASLVDFAATEKWAREHVPGSPVRNPALDEAAAVDAEEAAERAADAARQPEIEPGLKLPDNDGVWGLDVYRGTSELVDLEQNAGQVNGNRTHNTLKSSIDAFTGKKQGIILEGARAKVNFHINQPSLYIALSTPADDKAPEPAPGAFTVETQGGDAKNPKSGSSSSHYVVVSMEPKKTTRVLAALNVSLLGHVSQQQKVVDADIQILPGGHWMKVKPRSPLDIGQYALVEMISPKVINLDVWDFGVDPTADDNKGAITPIAPQNKRKPSLR